MLTKREIPLRHQWHVFKTKEKKRKKKEGKIEKRKQTNKNKNVLFFSSNHEHYRAIKQLK